MKYDITFNKKQIRSFKLSSVFVLFAALTFAASLFSCESTSQEVQKENTTFVNTKYIGNNLYTTMLFSKITSVTASDINGNRKFDISLDDSFYNPETSLLEITLPQDILKNRSNYIFKITGVPLFPAEFILTDAVYSYRKPGIFVNGKKAVEGKDYSLNTKTNHLKFNIPLDADKDSYFLIWFSQGGTNVMSNNDEKFKADYDKLVHAWIGY